MDEVLGPNGCLVADKGRKTCLACAAGTVFNALLAELNKGSQSPGCYIIIIRPNLQMRKLRRGKCN